MKTARFWIWGGIALVLVSFLLFGAGCTVTETAPSYPYGEPRGALISLAGLAAMVIGIGMIATGAIIKALGIEAKKELNEQQN